jgi:dihydrolipoamide dehydrogenase
MSENSGEFDFDVAIIGCGVGGHGCALHARGQSLKTAVFAGGDVGGTCVNRGCVPSKALLAASGRVRDMKDAAHLSAMGISVNPDDVTYDRAGIAAHAKNLANKIKGNLENSLVSLGVDVIEGRGILTDQPHQIKDSVTGKIYTAKVCLYYIISVISVILSILYYSSSTLILLHLFSALLFIALYCILIHSIFRCIELNCLAFFI